MNLRHDQKSRNHKESSKYLGESYDWLENLSNDLSRLSKLGFRFPQLVRRKKAPYGYILTYGLVKRSILNREKLNKSEISITNLIDNTYQASKRISLLEENLTNIIGKRISLEVVDQELARTLYRAFLLLNDKRVRKMDRNSVKNILTEIALNTRQVRINALKDTVLHSTFMNILTFLGMPISSIVMAVLARDVISVASILTLIYTVAPYPTLFFIIVRRGGTLRTKESRKAILQSWVLMTWPVPLPAFNTLGTYPSSIALQQNMVMEFNDLCFKYYLITGYKRTRLSLFGISLY